MTIYKCCPEGAYVDLDALAEKRLSGVLCLRCGRWFIGPGSPMGFVFAPLPSIPGTVYVDPDGSMHATKSSIRKLIAELVAEERDV